MEKLFMQNPALTFKNRVSIRKVHEDDEKYPNWYYGRKRNVITASYEYENLTQFSKLIARGMEGKITTFAFGFNASTIAAILSSRNISVGSIKSP